MASLGRVPNAENDNGNPVDVSDFAARPKADAGGCRNGKIASLHRRPIRKGREGRNAEPSGQARAFAASHLRRVRTAAVITALATLAGCMPLGDFERPRPSVVHGAVLPSIGNMLAESREEPVSDFPYTDSERELRDRAWSLLMPQLEDQHFRRWVAEMRRTRIMPVGKTIPDRDDYVEELLDDDFRSSGARFARLQMDIRNDRERYPPFVSAANLVVEFDRIRERSLAHTTDLTPEERGNAEGRIQENQLLISAVQASMRERAAIYRYALERLMIQTPDDMAIGAERELIAFEIDIGLKVVPPRRTAVTGK